MEKDTEILNQHTKYLNRSWRITFAGKPGLFDLVEKDPALTIFERNVSSIRVIINRRLGFDTCVALTAYLESVINSQEALWPAKRTDPLILAALVDVLDHDEYMPFIHNFPKPMFFSDGENSQFIGCSPSGGKFGFVYGPMCPDGEWGSNPDPLPIVMSGKSFFEELESMDNFEPVIRFWHDKRLSD